MSNVHFALVGGAHPHSRPHLKTLQQLPEVARVTVVDPDEAIRDAYRDEPKVAATMPTLNEALSLGATHVFVCVCNDRAPSVIETCANNGAHVIAEKPLAVSAEAFASAREAIRRTGVTLSVMYQARFHPIPLEARDLIRSGVIGKPMAAEARMVTSQVKFRDPTHWLFRHSAAGGGILSWLGCHYLDLLAYLLDDEYASVAAHADALAGEDIDVEDTATLSLRFSEGTLASMTAGYLLALSPSGYARGAYDTRIGVYGTMGRLWWDPVCGSTLYVESASSSWASAPRREIDFEVAPSTAYGGVYGERFVRRFIRASQGDGPPPTNLDDGLRILRLLDAAYESASTGRRITLA